MLIVYDSMTGNVKRFVDKLDVRNIKVSDSLIVDESFVLVTYTFGFGGIPDSTAKFINNNAKQLRGVASSGNMNWGSFYGKAADTISEKLNVPMIMKFELSGTNKDVAKFKQEVMKFDN